MSVDSERGRSGLEHLRARPALEMPRMLSPDTLKDAIPIRSLELALEMLQGHRYHIAVTKFITREYFRKFEPQLVDEVDIFRAEIRDRRSAAGRRLGGVTH